ncbi:MAG: hypothetical protein C0467_00640 [Planctomycetaceae bacterium]|nr:hypothetical protein [Planctomycetaceae bacterium]
MSTPTPTPGAPLNDQPAKFSKRQFLAGAVAGGCILQSGHWAAAALTANKNDDKPAHSYAQAGEDLIVGMMFDYLKLPLRTYIDIGAADPVHINNTYLFYTTGARGVLVEPNPEMTPRLRAKRPRDTVLGVGIGVTNQKEADFYRTNEPSWNTFDKETADAYPQSTGGRIKVQEVIKIPLVNVNDVFTEHFGGVAPDFVSLDVEGFELPILQSLNFEKYRPKTICIETVVAGTNGQKLEAVKFLVEKGYVARGSTFANTIMIDQKIL